MTAVKGKYDDVVILNVGGPTAIGRFIENEVVSPPLKRVRSCLHHSNVSFNVEDGMRDNTDAIDAIEDGRDKLPFTSTSCKALVGAPTVVAVSGAARAICLACEPGRCGVAKALLLGAVKNAIAIKPRVWNAMPSAVRERAVLDMGGRSFRQGLTGADYQWNQ